MGLPVRMVQSNCICRVLVLISFFCYIATQGYKYTPFSTSGINRPSLTPKEEVEATKRRLKIARNLVNFRKARQLLRCTAVDGVRAVEGAASSINSNFAPLYAFFNKDNENAEIGACIDSLKAKYGASFVAMPISESYMKVLRTGKMPPAVIVVTSVPMWDADDAMKVTYGSKVLVLDNLRNPNNVGALARSALAFNFTSIITLPNCADVYSPKAIRAASGLSFGIPINSLGYRDCVRVLERIIRREGSVKLATHSVLSGWDTVPREKVVWKPPFALVLGSEARGFSETFLKEIEESKAIVSLDMMDCSSEAQLQGFWNSTEDFKEPQTDIDLPELPFSCVRIGTIPSAESLNVAVAGGILMADSYAQRDSFVEAKSNEEGLKSSEEEVQGFVGAKSSADELQRFEELQRFMRAESSEDELHSLKTSEDELQMIYEGEQEPESDGQVF